jgi:hypothetical protein
MLTKSRKFRPDSSQNTVNYSTGRFFKVPELNVKEIDGSRWSNSEEED